MNTSTIAKGQVRDRSASETPSLGAVRQATDPRLMGHRSFDQSGRARRSAGSRLARTVGSSLLALSLALVVAVPGAVVSAADPTQAPVGSPGAGGGNRLSLGVGAADLILGPGKDSGSFVVGNSGDVEVQVTAIPFDFVVDANGKRVPATEPIPLGAAGWVAVQPSSFVVAPGTSRKVEFTVSVPDGAPPGDHYAGIDVLATMSDAEWAAAQAAAGGASLVRSKISYPQTIIVRVPGSVQTALSVTGESGSLAGPGFAFTGGGPYTFLPQIANDGNVAAMWLPASDTSAAPETVVPTLRLVNSLGFLGGDALLFEQNRDGAPAKVIVLPGETRTQKLALQDVPLLGLYTYTYTLPGSDADGRAPIVESGSVTLVNGEKVLLWIVLPLVILLVLLGILLLWRRRRRSGRAKAEVAKQQEIDRAREEGRREAMAQRTGPDAQPLADDAGTAPADRESPQGTAGDRTAS